MSYNSENTDKYFRERLSNFEQSPPESSWNTIVRNMDKKRRKRMLLLFVRIAAGMTILVSTGIGIYLVSQPDQKHDQSVVLRNDDINKNDDINTEQKNARQMAVMPALKQDSDTNRNISKSSNTTTNKMNADLSAVEIFSAPPAQLDNANAVPVSEEAFPFSMGEIENNKLPAFIENRPEKGLFPKRKEPADGGINELTENYLAGVTDEEFTGNLKQDRWSLGSEVAPLYSYRSINSDELTSSQMDNLNSAESGIISYAGGIHVAYAAGKRLSVQSGVYYSRYGQEKNQVIAVSNRFNSMAWVEESKFNSIAITNSTGEISGGLDDRPAGQSFSNDLYTNSDLTESFGKVNTNIMEVNVTDAENAVVRQYFDYFELPVILKYKIVDRRMDLNVSGGLVTNILIGNAIKMIDDDNLSQLDLKTTDISQVNYVGSIGFGFEYPLDGKFGLTLEPRFRYYLNPIDKSSVVVHPFSFGIFGGISYRF